MPVFPVVSSSYTATCFWCKSANIEALTLNPAIDNVVTKTHTAQWLEATKTVFASDACFLPDCQLSMIQMQEYKFHGERASHGDQEGKCQFWFPHLPTHHMPPTSQTWLHTSNSGHLVYQIAYKPQGVTPAQAHAVQTHTCLLMSKWSARRKENKPCLLKKCRTLMCFSMCRTLMRSWTVTYYPYISRTTQLTHLKWTHMHHVSM